CLSKSPHVTVTTTVSRVWRSR
ncbi:NAD(P) transhydrogenase beta subunit, partial [Vibrio parahaemolyticus V-223/04]